MEGGRGSQFFPGCLSISPLPKSPLPTLPPPPSLIPFRLFAISPLSHFAPYQFALFPLRSFPVSPLSQVAPFPSGPFLIHPFPFCPSLFCHFPTLPLFLFCPFPILPFSCFALFQFCPCSIILHKNYLLFTIWPLQFFRVRREVSSSFFSGLRKEYRSKSNKIVKEFSNFKKWICLFLFNLQRALQGGRGTLNFFFFFFVCPLSSSISSVSRVLYSIGWPTKIFLAQ